VLPVSIFTRIINFGLNGKTPSTRLSVPSLVITKKHLCSSANLNFIAETVRGWITAVGAKTAFIEPGLPWENGYCESFNGRMRGELLNGEIFYSLREAQIIIESWNLWGHCYAIPYRSVENTTTPNDPIVHWATAHLRQRPSSRWTNGQSRTNFQLGPLSGADHSTKVWLLRTGIMF